MAAERVQLKCAYCGRVLFEVDAGASGTAYKVCPRCKELNRLTLR